jgi:hypothetical protein
MSNMLTDPELTHFTSAMFFIVFLAFLLVAFFTAKKK